ncbi:MAG TPA: rhodanese-like domain-containing protein [Chitinophagaceae bacterium]
MKRLYIFLLPVCIFVITFSRQGFAQRQVDPWTPQQLIEPAALNAILHNSAAPQPVILDIGPAGVIKGAIGTGPAHEKEGMIKLLQELRTLPKDKFIVIYCGCCPFSKCPNIRPAFTELMKMGFTNTRLLNLSRNLKADWIDKGYPLSQ